MDNVIDIPSAEALPERLVVERLPTPVGPVPRVTTTLDWRDRLGAVKVRMNVGRLRYTVPPGLYAVGAPTPDSPVLVSANYKLSFDHLRRQLASLDAWILVLDTRGINVWCAAGKGTFGTEEVVRRIEQTRLAEIVTHRTLIMPQLGAPGVSGHAVRKQSGFKVIFGPVRAEDLPAFLDAGNVATPEMRRVRFGFADRAVLIPVEVSLAKKMVVPILLGLLVFSGLGPDGFFGDRMLRDGAVAASFFLAAFLISVILVPLLLPWLPGRAFSVKGAWLGAGLAAGLGGLAVAFPGMLGSRLTAAAWVLVVPALTSYVALNFTGASTYTSLSGVRKETIVSVPIQLVCSVVAGGLWIAGLFV